jgi:methylase of polypeptide subunit release factors
MVPGKVFGCHDWLCERVIAEVLPKEGYVSVLDSSCGSGSFLRAAITHMIRCNPKDSSEEQLYHILESVVGIDVHPLAATVAKATYVLALGKLVNSAKRPKWDIYSGSPKM